MIRQKPTFRIFLWFTFKEMAKLDQRLTCRSLFTFIIL